MIKIQIIYDNTSINRDLKPDWGFAALIQAFGKNILFDTGANGKILLDNMRRLDIDPRVISDVFISHGHFDHTGGLSHFLNKNNNITLHAPTSFRGVRHARTVITMIEHRRYFHIFIPPVNWITLNRRWWLRWIKD